MIRRMALIVLVAAALIALIIYSQIRSQPSFVSGVVEADEIRVGSRVAGRVEKVFVNEGDHVTAGTPLVAFELYDMNEREQQATSELAVREADLQKMTKGMREEEIGQAKARLDQLTAKLKLLEEGPRAEEIEVAKSRLNAAQSELVRAQNEYDRLKDLYQTRSVSKSDFDRAEETFNAATANVQVRENELAVLKSGAREQELIEAQSRVEEARLAWELAKKGFRTEEIDRARAARDAAAAALEIIRRQKNELTIVAPSSGYVDALDLQPGDLVAPGAPVLTLLSDKNLWVRAYVPQRFLRIQVGQQLRVTIDSLTDQEFAGEVTFISTQAEFTPSNVQTTDDRAKQVYRIRVSLANGPDGLKFGELRAGMTANVWLDPVEAN